MKKPYFPLFIDLSQKKIVIIGAGKIAQRRVETLLEFAGNILVAAPEATRRIRQLHEEGRILWIQDAYHKELLEGADLVLAATDDAVCNEQVIADCRARNIPANASHKKELCDFYFPGIIRHEDLVIGFSSGGQNHREVREAREKIEAALEAKPREDIRNCP